MGDRVNGGLRAIEHTNLREQNGQAVLDGAFSQRQLVGDFLVGHTRGDVLEDLDFGLRQLAKAILGCLLAAHPLELGNHRAGHRWIEQ